METWSFTIMADKKDSKKKDVLYKYSPIWAAAFTSGATALKRVGENYALKRKFSMDWKDLLGILGAGAVGYATFRLAHGNKKEGNLLTR